jgi:hypothetical protein
MNKKLLAFTMTLVTLSPLLLILTIGYTYPTKNYCQTVDTNERPSGQYTTRICNYAYIPDTSEAIVSIGKKNHDGTGIGITLTITELYKIACIIKCNQIYNTTIIK